MMYPMFYFDPSYVLILIGLLLSMAASAKVNSTYARYARVGARCGMTGAEAAKRLLNSQGIYDVTVRRVPGKLTDHYDPRNKTVNLSESVYGSTSIAAIGVAAHETGHALQYAKGYAPIQIRSAILPATRIGSTLAPYLVIAGLIFSFYPLAYAGIALFTLAVLFQLVTLPVEFNASARALRALEGNGMMTQEELDGAKRVLTAAAMTYVAALFVSLMSLLRLVLIVLGRGRRDN